MIELPEAIKKLSKRKSGCSTSFYQIGIKIFTSEEDCNYAYQYQKYAAKHKLGPLTGPKIKVGHRFGYITQVANTSKKTNEKEIAELSKAMRKINLDFPDDHKNNVGWIGNRLVCIDFDKYSVESKNYNKTKLPKPPYTNEDWF